METATGQLPGPPRTGVALRPPRADEWAPLREWLEDGLRPGRPGRLRSEYPTLLQHFDPEAHRVAWVGQRPAAHVLLREVEVRVDGRPLRLGMLGLVYTAPEFRRRGLARACIEDALARLAACGVPLAVLWSEREAFYRGLGFEPAGRERLYAVDVETCRRAAGGPRPPVGAVREGDHVHLEGLYAARRAHVARAPGELARLSTASACELRVARRDGLPVAYAALGRGDDFPDVVHEWAGAPDGVLACLETFAREREVVGWLCGPDGEEPEAAVAEAGAARREGPFALVRVLDPDRLWRTAVADAADGSDTSLEREGSGGRLRVGGREVRLDRAGLAGLLLGPRPPEAARRLLTDRPDVASRLPWPLFVWGFDSI